MTLKRRYAKAHLGSHLFDQYAGLKQKIGCALRTRLVHMPQQSVPGFFLYQMS
jgi:hypothetical protein